MKIEELVLNRLLDRYEKSKHLLQPGASSRRVMLRIDKKELPEYNYENAQIRDEWNSVVKELQERNFVETEWVMGRPVLSAVVLNLGSVMECYQAIGRTHPVTLAKTISETISSRLCSVSTNWIVAWRDDICRQTQESARIPSYCKKDLTLLNQLLTAFIVYDNLNGEPVTMRAFSSRCYQNTKIFEYEVRDIFLKIASVYVSELAEVCEQGELSDRDKLAYLGIYARPELYELSGDCVIQTALGTIDFAAAVPYGLAIPSTLVEAINAIDLSRIQTIIFIENKTNYDEFVLSEQKQQDLVVYHGGFLSPQKRKFFYRIAEYMPKTVSVYFWADIDLGGFRMFEWLRSIFPNVQPMRMSDKEVTTYHTNGLKRSSGYLAQVKDALDKGQFQMFYGAMDKILEYGVTIEQEIFLTAQ